MKQYVCNNHHAAAARDRLEITVAVQKMMLMTWEAHLENNTLAQEANNCDEKEVEAAMQQISSKITKITTFTTITSHSDI